LKSEREREKNVWGVVCHPLCGKQEGRKVRKQCLLVLLRGQSYVASHLGVKHPSRAQDQIYFCHTVTGLLMWAPSLTRGRLLALTMAVILESQSLGIHDNILLSQIRDSSNLEGQVPVFISPRNRVAQLYPRALHFRRLLILAGLRWRYSNQPPRGDFSFYLM
jgi:hypothetical protein